MYDHSKLRGRITEKYGTISAFSKALGLSLTSVSDKLNEKTGFSRDDIEKWSELLDISNAEIGLFYFSRSLK